MITDQKIITFTFDLEDHRSNTSYKKTYPDYTLKTLDFLDKISAKATFFVVGQIADDEPELIKRISDKGHEIAFHSHAHLTLDKENRKTFHKSTYRYKEILEDLTGIAVSGYRAPVFSLRNDTEWVLNELKKLGFKYSSSLIPGTSVLHGFSGAPKRPFYWNNGILEIPVPIISFGKLSIPFLGGFYLRYIPSTIIKYFIKKESEQSLWLYCHPYDFASDEPYFRIKNATHLISILLWFNRRNAFSKLENILSGKNIKISEETFYQQYSRGAFKNAEQYHFK